MKSEIIKKNGKTIAHIHLPCINYNSGSNKVGLISCLSGEIEDSNSGYAGFSTKENLNDYLLIFINPASLQYDRALSETVGHEFNHTVFLRDKKCTTLLGSMIFEGLAEHFREQIIGGDQAPWTKIFELNRAKVIFSEMKLANLLQSTDSKIHRGVFFGNEKYICWTGYTIGYYIVKSFLENNPSLVWKEIMTRQLKDILSRSSFSNK